MLDVHLLAAAVRHSLLARYVSTRQRMCCMSQRQSHSRDCWQVVGDHAHDDSDDVGDDGYDDDDSDDNVDIVSCSDTINCQCHNVSNNCFDNKLDFNRFVILLFVMSFWGNVCFFLSLSLSS